MQALGCHNEVDACCIARFQFFMNAQNGILLAFECRFDVRDYDGQIFERNACDLLKRDRKRGG